MRRTPRWYAREAGCTPEESLRPGEPAMFRHRYARRLGTTQQQCRLSLREGSSSRGAKRDYIPELFLSDRLTGTLLHKATMLLLALAPASFSIATEERAETSDKGTIPNIVLIMADDLGYGNLGCCSLLIE